MEENITQTNEEVTKATETTEETQEQSKQPTKNEILKELSKEWGINAFDPNQVKDKFNKLQEYEQSQKTELEKMQEQINSYSTKETEWNTQRQNYENQLLGYQLNINQDNLNDALALASVYKTNDTSQEDALKKVIEKYPNFVKGTSVPDGANVVKVGTVTDKQDVTTGANLSEQEKYMKKNYGKSRYYNPKQ